MWRMLTARSADLRVELREHAVDGRWGTAHWVARYTFGQTGRKVVNDVRSEMRFDDAGLIVQQRDEFDFWRWSRQALGPVGLLLGWTPVLQHSVRDKARGGLAASPRPRDPVDRGDRPAQRTRWQPAEVVVDHAGRLHQGVRRGRADEAEPVALQRLGHRRRLRR